MSSGYLRTSLARARGLGSETAATPRRRFLVRTLDGKPFTGLAQNRARPPVELVSNVAAHTRLGSRASSPILEMDSENVGLESTPQAAGDPVDPTPRATQPSAQGNSSRIQTDESVTQTFPEIVDSAASPPILLLPQTDSSSVRQPGFRVNWGEASRVLLPSLRAQAEREVIRAGRAEFQRRTENTAPSSILDIRVEHLTVRVESGAPAAAAPMPARSPTAAAGDSLSAYFLRRSISGF